MDVSKSIQNLKKAVVKYRFPALILILGVVLMLLPGRVPEQPNLPDEVKTEIPAEVALAQILSKIDGAGKVEVLLSIKAGEETVYQSDTDLSQSDSSSSSRVTTITVTGADRAEAGLIRQINPPVYLGAIIVCQGADRAGVRLSVVDAVSKLTGLGADSISVLKMN